MKNKFTYSLFLVLSAWLMQGQSLQLPLKNGHSCFYHGSLYVYGLSGQKPLSLCIYKMDKQLRATDSFVVKLPRASADNYLRLYSDTLHNYLNIYLQEKEKKLVNIYRFSKTFEPVAAVEQVDVARLNNNSLFSGGAFFFQNLVYDVKVQADTSGKQFYMNKYSLKSDQKNFDYQFVWQFPFEKKHIRSIHIFYADKKQVMAYVHISSGIKIGQWVLTVDAANGKLVRGTKMSEKGESGTYLFGTCMADSNSQTIKLLGEKYTPAQYSESGGKLNLLNRPFTAMYLLTIDSAGEVTERQDVKIPITAPSSGAKKTAYSFFLRVSNMQKNSLGGISFDADVYSAAANASCYLYSNTQVFSLIPGDDKLVLEKNAITTNPMVEKFYFTNDKLDMNGKICADSTVLFESLFYRPIIFPVKQAFKRDEKNNPYWVLGRSNPKKANLSYSFLQPVKNIYSLVPIAEVSSVNDPQMIHLSRSSFIIASQSEEEGYELKLFSW